jgi:hypothetical protein
MTGHSPRSAAHELQSLRQYRVSAGNVLKLLHEFLTVEGLIHQWPVFAHARINGTPYTPVYGPGTRTAADKPDP